MFENIIILLSYKDNRGLKILCYNVKSIANTPTVLPLGVGVEAKQSSNTLNHTTHPHICIIICMVEYFIVSRKTALSIF